MSNENTVKIQMKSPTGPRVLWQEHDDHEAIKASLPAGYAVDYAGTSVHRNGYAAPLVEASKRCVRCNELIAKPVLEHGEEICAGCVDDGTQFDAPEFIAQETARKELQKRERKGQLLRAVGVVSPEPMMDFKTDRDFPGSLLEITQEQHCYMRDVLPPIQGKGCFAMGEPVTHTDAGAPTYHWTGKIANKFYICYGTKTDAEHAFSWQLFSAGDLLSKKLLDVIHLGGNPFVMNTSVWVVTVEAHKPGFGPDSPVSVRGTAPGNIEIFYSGPGREVCARVVREFGTVHVGKALDDWREDQMKPPRVSLDGGKSWVTPQEAVASVPWEVITLALDKAGMKAYPREAEARDLSPNTVKRIARGMLKFAIKGAYLARILRAHNKDLVIE